MPTDDPLGFVQNPALLLAIAMKVSVPNSIQVFFHPTSRHAAVRKHQLGGNDTLPGNITHESIQGGARLFHYQVVF